MAADANRAKKILVVDDEKDVCVYLGRLFQENGYSVSCAANGNEALLEVEKSRPDLITLDLSMPETTGVRFYRELKARPELSGIPVVFVTGITGVGGSRDTEKFYNTRRQVPPPDAFIAKPIDPDEMLEVVRKLTTPGERQARGAAPAK
jgi:CheY-like chemotaxis protein